MQDLSKDNENLKGQVDTIAERANKAPREIKTDADLDAIGTLVKDARALSKAVTAKRVAAKEPFLTAEREVDGFFAGFTDRLNRIASAFQVLGDAYQDAKVAAERAKADAIAKKAREEQQSRLELARKADEAGRMARSANHVGKAEAASAQAFQAENVLAARPAEIARQRFDSGTVASAKGEWTFEITDYSKIPLDELRPYFKREDVEKALRLAVRQGVRDMESVRIFEQVKAQFR